jgi:hypothetical protein
MGKPALVNPHGIEIVGRPDKLNGLVLRHINVSFDITSSNFDGISLAFGGGRGVVGVTRASNPTKTFGLSRRC